MLFRMHLHIASEAKKPELSSEKSEKPEQSGLFLKTKTAQVSLAILIRSFEIKTPNSSRDDLGFQ